MMRLNVRTVRRAWSYHTSTTVTNFSALSLSTTVCKNANILGTLIRMPGPSFIIVCLERGSPAGLITRLLVPLPLSTYY